MTHSMSNKDDIRVTVFYDGACPFCKNYAAYQKLKTSFTELTLINLREAPPGVMQQLKTLGFNPDLGVVVKTVTNGVEEWLTQSDATWFFAQHTAGVKGVKVWWIVDVLSENKTLSKMFYPLFYMVRTVTVRLLNINTKF